MAVKQDISNFKHDIDQRLDNYFGSSSKTSFIKQLNKRGGELKHWGKTDTWDAWLDASENTSKPDDDTEFKIRKDAVLNCLAQTFIEWKVDAGKTAKGSDKGKQNEIKQSIYDIEDYQTNHKDPVETAIYDNADIKKLIKELKDLVKTTTTTIPFTKSTELKTLITSLQARIDGLFTDPDKSTFINEISTTGFDNHYWKRGENWKDFLNEEAIIKQANKDKVSPDEEFKRREFGAYYVISKAYIEWWTYHGRTSSSKAKKKEAIGKIEDYQTKFTEAGDQAVYNEEQIKKDIQAIKNAISKKPTPTPKPSKTDKDEPKWELKEAFRKVGNWWDGILDNYVKGGVAQTAIINAINKQGQETDSKFTKPDTWEDWFKTSKNQKELDEKWDWLEKELTKHLIDYWVAKGNAEHLREEKLKWWDNYIIKFYNKHTRELARHYYHENTYYEKLMKFKETLKDKETDPNKMKKNAIDELNDRMGELYTGTNLAKAITEINKMGSNAKSSDWGVDWKDNINKSSDENDLLQRKGFVLKLLTEYFIKDMMDRMDDQTDDGLAARYFQKLKDYKEAYGLEMGVYEAFEAVKTEYKDAEDRLKNITAIGVPVDQVYTMVYARDYGKWAGKPARRETRQPQDDTGTQNYYKPSEQK